MATLKRKPRANSIDIKIAARLRPARKHAGLTQIQVAKPLGVTFQQLQKYESGANRISVGKLAIFAGVCRRPIGWFFRGLLQPCLSG